VIAAALVVPTHRASSVTKYKVEQRLNQEADATALGAGKQTMAIKTTSFLTLTLTDSANGRAVRMVVDSVLGDSLPQGVGADMLEKAKGTVVTGFAGPDGGVTNISAPSENVAGLGLSNMVSQLVLRPRKSLKVGDAWTDTTETSNPVGGGSMQSRTVTNWQVSAMENRGGVNAARLNGASASAIAGAQETPGGAMDIEGTGTGTSSVYIAPDGRHLGGTTASTTNLNATLSAQGVTLPIVLTTSSTITVLP
jgi:hypothetical protein